MRNTRELQLYRGGLRASMTDASGTTKYRYDQVDRLPVKSTPFAVCTQWDLAGNQTVLRTEGVNSGVSISYTYDSDNRLSSVTDALGIMTNYTFKIRQSQWSTFLARGALEGPISNLEG